MWNFLSFISMNLDELNAAMSEMDEKNRSSIIKVINLKTESDMEKVISKMESMFAHVDARFTQIDARFVHLENKMDTKFAHVEDKMSIIKSIMIASGSLIGLMLTVLLATKYFS